MARITRKQMKRDEFVTAMGRFSEWMEDHVREVLIMGGIAVAAIVGGLLLAQYMQQREEKASALLGRGIDMLQATPGAAGTPNSYPTEQAKLEAVVSQMDSILQTYPRSKSGRLALYYRGVTLQQLGRTDDALKTLGDFVDSNPDSYAAPMARAAMAHAYESKGEADKALAIYDQLARADTSHYPPQAALADKARCLEGLGKKDEARLVYDRIVKEYPDDDFARDAQEKLKGTP
jgi:tetratricopeptide (TPR) repeat protein